MKTQLNITLAEATGYLGKHIAEELISIGANPTLIVRNSRKLHLNGQYNLAKAEVTKAETLKGVFNGVDVVISTVGITRQKDGLTYMDVDFQAKKKFTSRSS